MLNMSLVKHSVTSTVGWHTYLHSHMVAFHRVVDRFLR